MLCSSTRNVDACNMMRSGRQAEGVVKGGGMHIVEASCICMLKGCQVICNRSLFFHSLALATSNWNGNLQLQLATATGNRNLPQLT